ncbi:hypothetical protein K7432_009772 [Basidiobolus ranarum]|uniref:Fungal lipase-type domain-containing protein n=1 Tax=Basidiobolus ranarum TaxID=34480 RepID=A0ABR2VWK9_9FUNG
MKYLKNILALTSFIFGALALPASLGEEKPAAVSKDFIRTLARHAVYADAAYCSQLKGKVCSAEYRSKDMSYLAKDHLEWLDELEVVFHFKNRWSDLYAYIGFSKKYKEVVIGFKGTSFTSIRSIWTNTKMDLVKYGFPKQKNTSRKNYMVHDGYFGAFSDLAMKTFAKLETVVKTRIQGNGYKLVIVGHSQGGAIASIGAMEMQKAYQLSIPAISTLRAKIPSSRIYLHTFAQPRVGNKDFASLVYNVFGVNRLARVTNHWDPVPGIPSLGASYFHHPNEIYIAPKGQIQRCNDVINGRVVEDLRCSASARVKALYYCYEPGKDFNCPDTLATQFEEHKLSEYIKFLSAAAR